MKKVLSVALTILVIVMSFTAVVSAAPVDDVIKALQDAKVPAAYVEQARSYFAANAITADQATAIVANVKAASTAAAGKTKLSELSDAQVTAIMTEIKEAAQVVGLTASYDNGTINVKDSTGKLVISESGAGAVKQTGFDYSIVLFGLAGLVIAGASALVIKKKFASDNA